MQANILFDTSANQKAIETLAGLRYEPDFLNSGYESAVLAQLQTLQFHEFEFHGYLGKRRIVSFGWRYEYSGRGELKKAEDIPDFLLGLRRRAASFAQLEPEALQQVLVTEYRPGAGIGWHRDKPVFDQVVGISLLAPCLLRFRRKAAASLNSGKVRNTWQRVSLLAPRRSVYLLRGPARLDWEHSILRVDELRYSITFRSLR